MTSPSDIPLPLVIQACGGLQLSILIASALVPTQLDWKRSLAALPTLLRQMFWVYAGYTAMAIVALALLSLLAANDLAAGGRLARLVCGANALFWGIRLCLQGVFDTKPFLTKSWLKAGYHLLTVLFALFTGFYGGLAFRAGT